MKACWYPLVAKLPWIVPTILAEQLVRANKKCLRATRLKAEQRYESLIHMIVE